MPRSASTVTADPAYRFGAAAFVLSVGAILLALALEYAGYQPCPLCLQQRWAYYAAIPGLFVTLVMVAADYKRVAAVLFLVVALAFLANAGLAGYHTGVEWKFWPGPDTCDAGAAPGASPSAAQGGLLKQLETTRVVRCDAPALLVLGLSLAAWNVVASLLIFGLALRAAFASAKR